MSVQRIMGTETEYGVHEAHAARYNPVELSFAVIDAAARDDARRRIRWDYRREDPVNDARGTRLERAAAHPDLLTDEPQTTVINIIAPNGGRMYVDHAHPEYSAPETTDPFMATAYDYAGDLLMQEAAQQASQQTGKTIALMRTNVDGKGASWGTHENYMMDRAVPFHAVASLCATHFVTRQIYAGSGRVGLGERSEQAGYQLSQRADYIHMIEALQTTFDRPIINTRDEPHAPADQRRLHVIVGDANRMPVPQTLKLGTTSMLLWVLETAYANPDAGIVEQLQDFVLADPVQAMHEVSHDLTLRSVLALTNGERQSAWNIQVRLYSLVYEVAAMVYGADSLGEPLWPDKPTRSLVAMWKQALLDCGAIMHADDDARLSMSDEASRVEWLLKWQMLERLRRRIDTTGTLGQSAWADARIQALDLRWSVLDPYTSLVHALDQRGLIEHVCSAQEVHDAARYAPPTTRAWTRAAFINQYAEDVVAASWTQLTVRNPKSCALHTVDMTNPRSFAQGESEPVFKSETSALAIVERLNYLQSAER